MSDEKLPPVTILIEWENAQDVEDFWVRRAMTALQDELERQHNRCAEPPRVMYLFNQEVVSADDIRKEIALVAPKLPQLCKLEFQATPGLTYYKLKNYGVGLTKTEFVVMVDSDAGPQPGWLPAILKPFERPEVMAVGGFTMLGYNNLVSKVMALTWIFNLKSERDITLERHKIHANNCAFRTEFFKANPWPDLPAFKKQCGFWIRDIEARGIPWVRTAEAMTIHAPQPGIPFLTWRAWTAGLDRDYQGAQTISQSKLRRLLFALQFWLKKSWRATRRIIGKGHEVDLPVWQMPAALFLAYGYYGIAFVAQLYAALTRSYEPLRALRQVSQH
jgi:Glycosyl transferase family 2